MRSSYPNFVPFPGVTALGHDGLFASLVEGLLLNRERSSGLRLNRASSGHWRFAESRHSPLWYQIPHLPKLSEKGYSRAKRSA